MQQTGYSIFYSAWGIEDPGANYTRQIILVVGAKPVWCLCTACLSLRWWPDVSAAQRGLWSFYNPSSSGSSGVVLMIFSSLTQMIQLPHLICHIHVKWIWGHASSVEVASLVYCCHERALLFCSVIFLFIFLSNMCGCATWGDGRRFAGNRELQFHGSCFF